MEYYERLRQLREDKDLTQEQVAQAIGTSQSYYSKQELGKKPIPLEQLKSLALLFEVSADYILGLPKNLKWPR
ncbi:MAG: helix-turn-helix transcriptional regulator [Oscillospiraceae bacterium]|nr:helix-turn-helix transcriptional regulator [Oscillospiraceae bacterium]